MKKLLLLSLIIICFACSNTKQVDNSLTYIMDMAYKNPGEPRQKSNYYNPQHVKSIGYNGIVPQMYVQCALTYDSFEKGLTSKDSKEIEWILKQQEFVKKEIKEAKDAGLEVYPFTDVLVLPNSIIEKYKSQIVDDPNNKGVDQSVHGNLSPSIDKEMTVTLIKAQIKELFETFPDLDGLVVRFGETYLYDTPYHSGGSPVTRDRGEKGVEGHVKFINLLKAEVCEKYNKKIFYRTWDFGFFHTDPQAYKAITEKVEPHPNLIFSIKYCRGDFHRLTQFNPTIGIGKHPFIIEYQAQPEYYGKGAHPVYLFGSVLSGFSEYKRNMESDQIQSMAAFKGDPRFKGLWTWSRGGGWNGPYIKHELWCDINAHAAAIWAQDTTKTESQVLDKTLTNLTVKKGSLKDFKKLLKLADEAVLKGQCTDMDVSFNIWWSRDQYFYNYTALRIFLDDVIEKGLYKEAIDEKNYAVGLWDEIIALANNIEMEDKDSQNYLVISSKYGKFKHDIIRQIFIMALNYRNMELNGKVIDMNAFKQAIADYDSLYADWKKLEEENPLCANIYQPYGFALSLEKGAYGNPDNGICVLVDKCKKLVVKPYL